MHRIFLRGALSSGAKITSQTNRGARTPACRVETLLDASSPRFTGRRQECRRGTQECVRHMGQQPNVKLFLRDPLVLANLELWGRLQSAAGFSPPSGERRETCGRRTEVRRRLKPAPPISKNAN